MTLACLISGMAMGQGVVTRKTTPVKKDTIQTPPKKPEVKKEKVSSGTSSETSPENRKKPIVTEGTLQLGYGVWTGGIKNNKPDGKGRLTFSTTHTIDKYSSSVANPDDYMIATYDNGQLISGKLYDKDGQLLKTIIP